MSTNLLVAAPFDFKAISTHSSKQRLTPSGSMSQKDFARAQTPDENPVRDTFQPKKFNNLPFNLPRGTSPSATASIRVSSRNESVDLPEMKMTPAFFKDFTRLKQQVQDLTALVDHQVESQIILQQKV